MNCSSWRPTPRTWGNGRGRHLRGLAGITLKGHGRDAVVYVGPAFKPALLEALLPVLARNAPTPLPAPLTKALDIEIVARRNAGRVLRFAIKHHERLA